MNRGEDVIKAGLATGIMLCAMLLMGQSARAAGEGPGRFVVTPYAGWVFGGKASTLDGDLRIRESADYGFNLDFPYQGSKTVRMRFSYSTYDTTVEERIALTGEVNELFDLRVDQYQLGGTKLISDHGRLQTYGLGTFGLTHFAPHNSRTATRYSSETLFSMNFGVGMDVMLTKRLGLNLQGRLLLPFNYYGGSLFCGSGGCNIGISGGSSLMQADVTAGMVVKF